MSTTIEQQINDGIDRMAGNQMLNRDQRQAYAERFLTYLRDTGPASVEQWLDEDPHMAHIHTGMPAHDNPVARLIKASAPRYLSYRNKIQWVGATKSTRPARKRGLAALWAAIDD